MLVYFTHKGHRMFAFERIISQVTIALLQAFPCSQVFCTTPLPSLPSCFTFFQEGVIMTIHYVAQMTNCQCIFFKTTLVFKNEVLLHFVYSCYFLSFQQTCAHMQVWGIFGAIQDFKSICNVKTCWNSMLSLAKWILMELNSLVI